MAKVVTLPAGGWVPRHYQYPLWYHFESNNFEGIRAAIVWHRRAGKDLTAIHIAATASQQRVGIYWHILPTYNQGRKVVWDGRTNDGKAFLDAFPKELVAARNNTEMKLTLKNGSIYQVVGGDDVDRLVGTNPCFVILSEYSIMDERVFTYLMPILTANNGSLLAIYTPRGKNHAHRLIEAAAKNKKWFDQILTVDDTDFLDRALIDEDRKMGMPEETIQQEYWCSFEAPVVGAYYSEQMMDAEGRKDDHGNQLTETRITNVPYEERLLVHTAWDLGVRDATSIWFYQLYGQEIRLIDYHEETGKSLSDYIRVLKEKGYNYGTHWAPHDIEVREFTSGKSRKEMARELGFTFRVCKKHNLMDGINNARGVLRMCWFDKVKCARGIEALRQYRKEFDDKKDCFKDTPLHDWASHGADAFRYLAWTVKVRNKVDKSKMLKNAITEYDIFNL
jgi:hypothetical protein